jgi:hypothetical protein
LPLALHVGGTTITVALPGEVGDCEGLQTLAVPTTLYDSSNWKT